MRTPAAPAAEWCSDALLAAATGPEDRLDGATDVPKSQAVASTPGAVPPPPVSPQQAALRKAVGALLLVLDRLDRESPGLALLTLAAPHTTQRVQVFTQCLRAYLKEMGATGTAGKLPAWETYQQAIGLVQAHELVVAPDRDMMAHCRDYAEMCRHASGLARDLRTLGEAVTRNAPAQVKAASLTLTQRWTAYGHHERRLRESLGPKTLVLPEHDVTLTEAQVHALLCDPTRFPGPPNDRFFLELQLRHGLMSDDEADRYALPFEVLEVMRKDLLALDPTRAAAIDDAFDVTALKRRLSVGALEPRTFVRCCSAALAYLPDTPEVRRLQQALADSDCDGRALASVLAATRQEVALAKTRAFIRRVVAALPALGARGPAWERANFEVRRRALGNYMPRTVAWLEAEPVPAGATVSTVLKQRLVTLLLGAPM
ncbi:MAG TPA: hypothetical protein VFH51_19145, partial [Myxococcota bacterium]|nr:hypothetical protein [Myxococcota bacterium]